jgi:hypothetical protein
MKESEGTTGQARKSSPKSESDQTRALEEAILQRYREGRGILDTQSGRGRGPRPKPRPIAATCTPRQQELPLDLPPCRRRSQIHALRFLAEQLGEATNRLATFDTIWLAEWRIFESMLREARVQLDLQLARALSHSAAIQESSPQTSRPL